MKKRILLMSIVLTAGMMLVPLVCMAAPNASIVYEVSDLGNGSWRYDYTLNNESTSIEYLYSVWFDFGQTVTVTGLPLPAGWAGTVWAGMNTTAYLEASSTGFIYDIASGHSADGFSFTSSAQIGSIPFTAYFDNHAGSLSSSSGSTMSLIPEPISSILFITGGTLLAGRRMFKRGRS